MQVPFTLFLAVIFFCVSEACFGEPEGVSRVLGSGSCATSGCHGGAGLGKGAYNIWKHSDPHDKASATLTNGQSTAIAQKMGIKSAAESVSCTACHAPMKNVAPSLLMPADQGPAEDKDFSCANCHGGAEKWILSHTRPDYPRAALEKLGMRPLGNAYQRANACVACHQNLSNELVKANHPPLIFELDGLLVEQPKHWREDADFSHVKTWLIGQAVALREIAAQTLREPTDARTAEIEAIKELLAASGTGWDRESKTDLVKAADDFAKRVSAAPMSTAQARTALGLLLQNRKPFEISAFGTVAEDHRMRAVGHYAERLALALDRLNQSLIAAGEKAAFAEDALNELFNAAPPPKSFDVDITENFVRKLDAMTAVNK